MSKINNKNNTIKRVLLQIRPYLPTIILLLALAVVSVLCSLYIPVLVGDAIDAIIGKEQVNFAVILPKLFTCAVLIGCAALAQWLMNVCGNKVTYNTIRDMREAAFKKIHRLPFSYLDAHETGDIVSRIIADVDQFADGLLMGFSQLFTGVVTIIGTIGFMLSVNVWTTLVVVLITPLSILVARFIAKKTFAMFRLQSETRGRQTAFINEMITNQKVVRAYGHEDENMEKFDTINEELRRHTLKATFFSSITNPATRFVNSVVYAAVALIGAFLAVTGQGFTIGMLSCFLSYANQYTKPFNEISGVITGLLYGGIDIQFRLRTVVFGGKLTKLAERHLKTPDIEDIVLPEILEITLSRHLQRRTVNTFPADPYPRRIIASVSERRCAPGADPVTAAVVLFFLFFQTLLQHFLQLFKVVGLEILHCLLQRRSRHLILVFQPVPDLLRNILLMFHTFKKLSESEVEFIVFRLALDQNRPAEIVKRRQTRLSQSLIESLHQRHPLIERDLKTALSQQIEKFYKHISFL